MKKTVYFFLFVLLILCAPLFSFAQADDQGCLGSVNGAYLHGNEVRAFINNSGSLFFDGDNAAFQVPYGNPATNTIFAQGLWLGGFDPAGNLKLAAQTYGLAYGEYDYFPGPLDEEGMTGETVCQQWDRVWVVNRYQMEAHLADFEDNGVIDEPQEALLSWPGLGNPHFSGIYGFELPNTTQGLAPFFDENGDGMYDPLDGDYPMIKNATVLPEQIAWNVFNDNGNIHVVSNGNPLGVEIQLTSWAFNCSDNPQLNQTIFTSYKVINRGIEPIDSLYMGLWIDFDLGCYTDDYVGTAPELNSAFVYNSSNIDEEGCFQGVSGYGENPPVQAVTILNKELSYAMYYNNAGLGGIPPMIDPTETLDYYYLLTGRWRDGTPLTYGGDGYDPTGGNPETSYAFPSDPNDPEGWSMQTENLNLADRRFIPSVLLENLAPGNLTEVDIAYSYFRIEGNDQLENVTAMYGGIADLQGWYDQQFDGACGLAALCEEDCVWAGDTNADGIANHCDLLPIGLALSESGPVRSGPYNWSPRNGDGWTGEQLNGVNDKHIDADGNGVVEPADFILTEQHYHLTRPGYVPVAEYPEGPELSLEAIGSGSFEDLTAGSSFLVRVNLADVPDLHGLAFTVEYDPVFFSYFLPIGGGGFSDNGLQFVKDSPQEGTLEFARIPIDPEEPIEGGALLVFDLSVHPDFPDPVPSLSSLIRFKNIKAVDSDGAEIEMGGTTVVATFQGLPVGSTEELVDNSVRLFPNPTDGRLELRFEGVQIDRIELFSTAGARLWQHTGPVQDAASLNLADLPEGIYMLRLHTEEGLLTKKVVLQKR